MFIIFATMFFNLDILGTLYTPPLVGEVQDYLKFKVSKGLIKSVVKEKFVDSKSGKKVDSLKVLSFYVALKHLYISGNIHNVSTIPDKLPSQFSSRPTFHKFMRYMVEFGFATESKYGITLKNMQYLTDYFRGSRNSPSKSRTNASKTESMKIKETWITFKILKENCTHKIISDILLAQATKIFILDGVFQSIAHVKFKRYGLSSKDKIRKSEKTRIMELYNDYATSVHNLSNNMVMKYFNRSYSVVSKVKNIINQIFNGLKYEYKLTYLPELRIKFPKPTFNQNNVDKTNKFTLITSVKEEYKRTGEKLKLHYKSLHRLTGRIMEDYLETSKSSKFYNCNYYVTRGSDNSPLIVPTQLKPITGLTKNFIPFRNEGRVVTIDFQKFFCKI